MADLYASVDGSAYHLTLSGWAGARDGAGTNSSATAIRSIGITNTYAEAGRGGAMYAVQRSFYYFDTSGITGTVSSATFKIYGYSQSSGSIIGVSASSAFGGDGDTAIKTDDFDSIDNFVTGSSLAGTSVVDFTAEKTSGWNTSGYNDLASTADLRANMQSEDHIMICVMDYTYDYLNSDPGYSPTHNAAVGGHFSEYTGTSRDPYITYVEAAGAVMASVNGITDANAFKVNTVTNDGKMEKINGITDTD